jgi:hypothetical protein
MKRVISLAVLLWLGGCVTQHRTVTTLSLPMMLFNQGHPFVSESFAERLALLVFDEKYPKDIFSARGPGNIVDKGDVWLVTFENALVSPDDANALPTFDGKVVARRLTVTIRKTNGEIVTIS